LRFNDIALLQMPLSNGTI